MNGPRTDRGAAWRIGVTWLPVALGLAVTLPGIGIGLTLDDHAHAFFVQTERAAGTHRFWQLFDLCGRRGPSDIAARIADGALPWWTLPNLSMSMFRPLAGLSHYIDYAFFPTHPIWMHLENCAWYALLVWIVAKLYRRIDGARTATLGALLFAVCEAHAGGTAWIASRNTLMTAAAVAGVLVAHDSSRRDGSRAARRIAPLLLLAGYACSEGAIAAWAYLVPYAVFLDRGSPRNRASSLAPFFVVTAAWQFLYRVAGYGMRGSAAYRDPFTSPRAFFTERVPAVLPVTLRELLVPGGLGATWSRGLSVVPWVTAAIVLGCGLLLLRLALGDRRIAFWLSALVLAPLPACVVDVAPRLFLIPSIAALALIAELSLVLLRTALAPGRLLLRAGAAAFAIVLLFVHGVRALWAAPHAHESLLWADLPFRFSAAALPPHDPSQFDELYVVNTPNFFITVLSPLYAAPGVWPARRYVLGSSMTGVRMMRPDSTSIVLEARNGYLTDPYSRMVRAPEYPFTRGEVVHAGALRVTVEETTPDGRPLRVRFYSRRLDAPRALWVTWEGGCYRRVELPPIGTASELPGT